MNSVVSEVKLTVGRLHKQIRRAAICLLLAPLLSDRGKLLEMRVARASCGIPRVAPFIEHPDRLSQIYGPEVWECGTGKKAAAEDQDYVLASHLSCE